jgi:hypothetical protein
MSKNDSSILNFLTKKTARKSFEEENEDYYNNLIKDTIGLAPESEEIEEIDYDKKWTLMKKSEIKIMKDSQRKLSFVNLEEIKKQIEERNKKNFTEKYKNNSPYDLFSKFIDD